MALEAFSGLVRWLIPALGKKVAGNTGEQIECPAQIIGLGAQDDFASTTQNLHLFHFELKLLRNTNSL